MFSQVPMDLLVHIAVIRDRIAATFLDLQNVVACGIGFKVTEGQVTSTPCVIVSVERKIPVSQLPESQIIPRLIQNIPTDVVETGLITALGIDRIGAVRPIRPGISIAHRDGTAGTLGCIVRRGDQRLILSNNHVMALLNQARIGDPILQPGPSDGGTFDNRVAELLGFETIRFFGESQPDVIIVGPDPEPSAPEPQGCAALISQLLGRRTTTTSRTSALPESSVSISSGQTIPENRVDAAIAKPYANIAIDQSIIDLQGAPTGIADPGLGMHVFKSGRSTDVSEGFITQVDVTVDVTYGERRARYVNQMMMTPMSDRGDSGSLLINSERRAVGLIFSGSNMVSVASPIRFVLAAMRVDLVTA